MNAPRHDGASPPAGNEPPSPAPPAPAPQTPSTAPLRLDRIDVLRALAAFAVIAYHHLGWRIGWHWPMQANGFPDLTGLGWKIAPLAILAVGWAGVPLFFALSGFCIHSGFLRSRTFTLRTFFWRRFWRIYPPFIAAVAVFCFWPIPHLANDVGTTTLLGHLSMLFTLSPDSFWSPINASLWSVGVEFQCYLLYPIFLLLRSRWGTAPVAIGWFLFGISGRIIAGAALSWPDHPIGFWYCLPLFSFGDWALGALVAEDLFNRTERKLCSPAALAGLAALCFLSTLWRPALSLSFALAAATGALLIKFYAGRPSPANRIESTLARIGLISYSLYLWHQPLLEELTALGRNLSAPLPLNLARLTTQLVMVIGLLVIAAVSYLLLERPGMAIAAWRRKSPSPTSP